jgi:sigma-B regulation protein RsbU (phosphoserine phosphatase)
MEVRPKILIVDDEINIRRALGRVFPSKKYLVKSVANGAEALFALSNDDFNLVISDLKMPGMNGIDLLSLARDKYPRASQILLSGNADIDDLDSAISTCNIQYFVSKPWRNSDLLTKVEAVINENMLLRQKQSESDHMQDELIAATAMQQSLLPDPIVSESLNVDSLYEACVRLGGDAFNYEFRDQKLHFYMIDVVGHGAAAAMESFALQHLLARVDFSEPDQVTKKMNNNYMYLRDPMRYFTMLSGTYDIESGVLRFCQAGHPSPLLVKPNDEIEVLGDGGYPVGMISDASYDVTETTVNKEDLLLMFSDGLAEQGCENLKTCLTSFDGLNSEGLIAHIISWRLSQLVDDDVSALFLRR